MSSDDDTPVIDEGLTLRASQMDWSLEAQHPPAIVVCRNGHSEYRSLAKFDLASDRIIAKTGCPACGTHEMMIRRALPRADTVWVLGVRTHVIL